MKCNFLYYFILYCVMSEDYHKFQLNYFKYFSNKMYQLNFFYHNQQTPHSTIFSISIRKTCLVYVLEHKCVRPFNNKLDFHSSFSH